MELDIQVEPSTSMNIQLEPSTSTGSSTAKLGLCEVCAYRDAKYSCPRCEVKTCSLKCNKIHKLEIECDGRRDPTKFVPLNKFTNLDLSSDYRLLEEISRTVETSRKKFENKWNNIPHQCLKLRSAANLRKVNLKFLPFKFCRRQNNTSCFVPKQNLIYWHVEWIFVNAENLKLSDKVPETEKLSLVLSKYLSLEVDASLAEKLQYYQAAGVPGVKLFLKAEKKAGKKFYELDATVPLRECLQKRLIIEYPTIHVVLKDHGCAYDIIDSDDEEMETDEGKVKSGNDVVEKIITNAENDESLYESLKNLLFLSEYSDEEIVSE